jgi:hypothetical protein
VDPHGVPNSMLNTARAEDEKTGCDVVIENPRSDLARP